MKAPPLIDAHKIDHAEGLKLHSCTIRKLISLFTEPDAVSRDISSLN